MSPSFSPVPDRILLRIQRDHSRGFTITLTLPDGSTPGGARLNLDALEDALASLEQSQPVWSSRNPAAYGQILYRHLFPEPLGFHYAQAVAAAGYRGVQLLLALDPNAPELHYVPWERLFQPFGGGWKPVGASSDIFLARFLAPQGVGWQTPWGSGPLRMLVVIANPYPPGHQRHFDAQAAWESLEEALQPYGDRVMVRHMEAPITADRIVQALAQTPYHILHFMGHGIWDEQSGQASLILATEQDGTILPDKVDADSLIAKLQVQATLPMLITLATCQSAFPGTREALSGLTPRLILAGCPAVVGMLDEIGVESAKTFYRTFYEMLLQSGYVDQAITHARAALYAPDTWEWAVPSLTMRLQDGLLFLPDEQFKPAHRVPYKYLAPYTAADADIFKGREELSNRVAERVDSYRVTVLYGEPGVGITSLLEAGVRPKLEEQGDLVIHVTEYEDIASEVRLQVRWQGRPLRLALRGDAPLEEVLRAISAHTGRRIVLMMDQFERVFALGREKQDTLADEVVAAMATLGDRLKLVIAMHTGYLGDFATLQERFQAIAQPWIETPVLPRDAAAEAIVGPLQTLGWPVMIQPEFAQEQIARDLDALYEPEKEQLGGSVHPAQLQIVCYWLYEQARKKEPPEIDQELYVREAGGAEGILTRYMQHTLATRLADVRELAEHILVKMAAPRAPLLVRPEDLVEEGASLERIAMVLERLAEARLLIHRRREGRIAYAFANVIVAQEARNLGGEALRLRYLAEDELERIWRMWIAAVAEGEDPTSPADHALPNPDQLTLLAQAHDSLAPLPVQSLMLLRAAVKAHDITLQPWFSWVQAEGVRDLLRWLDTEAQADAFSACGVVAVDRARRLLGLVGRSQPTTSSVGALAQAAIHHPDGVTRQTAALALAALKEEAGVAELEEGLRSHLKGPVRWLRASQLFGILADASNLIPPSRLSPGDRLGAWGWRVGRRLAHQWQPLWAQISAAALSVGFLFATFRFFSASIALGHSPGIQFGVGLWWGLLMGICTALGLLLPEYLLLRHPQAEMPPPRPAARIFIILFGAAAFALSITLIAGFASLSDLTRQVFLRVSLLLPRAFLIGLPAGLGLSIALAGYPWQQNHIPFKSWLMRLGALVLGAIAAFGVAHLLNLNAFSEAEGLPGVGIAGDFYVGYLGRYAWSFALIQTHASRIKTLAGFLDLVFVLLVLFTGTLSGLRWVWPRVQRSWGLSANWR